MQTTINYEDNIFFVHSLIHTLRAGLVLQVDPDYFCDKIIEDLLFLDRAITQLYELLNENRRLIRRAELSRKLLHATSALLDLFQYCIEQAVRLKMEPEARTRLRTCRGGQQRILDTILAELRQENNIEISENIVSSAEFEFLLRGESIDGADKDRT